MGMVVRRRLGELELTGARKVIRRVLFAGVAILAAIGAFGYLLPAHRLLESAVAHSNYADGGPATLVVFASAALCWLFARRRGYGTGYLFGLAAIFAAVLAVVPVFLVHLLRTVEHGPGEALFSLGVIGMFGLGIVIMIAEPILYLGQRRQLERDVDPHFPTARALKT
jgi:uncharacterized protein (TIGR03382 family)